jgi:hypothetical protein
MRYFLPVLLTWALSGCTNYLYQGQFSGIDANGNKGQFQLYWTKTDKLIGSPKAGPAILRTECSFTAIAFEDQPEGIIFRGEQGRDRLPGNTSTVDRDQPCGKILNHTKLTDVREGDLSIMIGCEPMPQDDFDTRPRNYPKARTDPYVFTVTEAIKQRSLFGETLPAPILNCTH